jgi:hypothetical protein
VGRKRQCYRGRQFHDRVSGLGRADAETCDHDGDHRHFCSLGAVSLGRVDGEGFQPVRHHRDHAVARFFEQALIDPRHHDGCGVSLGLVRGVAGDHDVAARTARAVDNGDGLLLGRGGLLGCGVYNRLGSAWGRRGNFLTRGRRLTQRDMRDRLAPERIVVEDGKTHKATRNSASTTASTCVPENGNRYRRLRRTLSCPSGVLRSSAVSAMDLPESTGRRYHGRAGS